MQMSIGGLGVGSIPTVGNSSRSGGVTSSPPLFFRLPRLAFGWSRDSCRRRSGAAARRRRPRARGLEVRGVGPFEVARGTERSRRQPPPGRPDAPLLNRGLGALPTSRRTVRWLASREGTPVQKGGTGVRRGADPTPGDLGVEYLSRVSPQFKFAGSLF